MILEELLRAPDRFGIGGDVEVDALIAPGAMQEAQLLALRIDSVRSTAWLLFDCRGALQIDCGNTVVIAVSGMTAMTWSGEPRGPRTAWSVVGWDPAHAAAGWSVEAAFAPRATLTVAGGAAEFYVGDVPGCDAAPPDYTQDSDLALRAGLAGWSSEFSPVLATFLPG